jgi:hypothetical protein
MGRKRDDRTEKPKSKFAGGKAKRRQQDPKSWKKLEMNALKKSISFKYLKISNKFNPNTNCFK